MTTKIPTKFDLEDMLRITARLNEIMEFEVSELKQMRVKNLKTDADEKLKLITLLEAYKKIIRERPSVLETLTEEQMKDFRYQVVKFGALLNEDRKQLIRVKNASHRVMDLIRNAVKEKTKQISSYNRTGKVMGTYNKPLYTPAIALNEHI